MNSWKTYGKVSVVRTQRYKRTEKAQAVRMASENETENWNINKTSILRLYVQQKSNNTDPKKFLFHI